MERTSGDLVIRIDRRLVRPSIAVGALLLTLAAFSEQLTLTTTYPSPVGIYNYLITTGNNNMDTILARNGARVGIGTAAPAEKLNVDNGSVRIDDTSAYVRLRSKGQPSGAQGWQITDAGPFSIRPTGGDTGWSFANNGLTVARNGDVTAAGSICNGSGQCVGGPSSMGQTGCFWQAFTTHGNYVCPVGYFVAGVCMTNMSGGCNPAPFPAGSDSTWNTAGGVYCCKP